MNSSKCRFHFLRSIIIQSNKTHQILARLPLFRELTADQLENLLPGVKEVRLDKGRQVFTKGDMVQGLHVIAYGQVKLYLPSLVGNEKVVEIIGPQQSLGEAMMFLERPYPVSAETLADSLLLHVSKERLFNLLGSDASFARRMLAGLSVRLHSLVADVESYSLRSSSQRIIGYLLQHCPDGTDGAPLQGSREVTLTTTKQVIASLLNLTPETLSRIFSELTSKGLIEVQGRTIRIPDVQRLREFDLG